MPANPQVEAYIRQAAIARGIDPEYAVRVARSEALNVFDPTRPDRGGDEGSSFGPFQLHYAGISRSMPRPGLGDEFTRATGLRASDPSTWQQQVDFALDTAKRDGWRQWMGAANTGIPRWAGINQKAMPTQAAQPQVMDGPKGDEQLHPAGYSTRPGGPVEAAGGGAGSDPRGVLATLFTGRPGGPVEAAGGGAGSDAGSAATGPVASASPAATFWDKFTKNLGKVGSAMAKSSGDAPGGRPGAMPQPAAVRIDQGDVPTIDPQAVEAQRQQLAMALARLNSGRLF